MPSRVQWLGYAFLQTLTKSLPLLKMVQSDSGTSMVSWIFLYYPHVSRFLVAGLIECIILYFITQIKNWKDICVIWLKSGITWMRIQRLWRCSRFHFAMLGETRCTMIASVCARRGKYWQPPMVPHCSGYVLKLEVFWTQLRKPTKVILLSTLEKKFCFKTFPE